MAAERLARATPTIALVALALQLSWSLPANAAPAIRTDPANAVPGCVTPVRLMAFLAERNPGLDARFKDIANHYRYFGDAWRVRWDYAFFQMVLETNYLTFRRPGGVRGDVDARQNNFAGIGATGGGVAGDRFATVATGVHAQIQHLVAYSGERLAAPIASRTRLKQDDIISQSRRLNRPVTFGDLARRWAVDRNYARSIDKVASQFQSRYCGSNQAGIVPPPPVPARRDMQKHYAPPSGLGAPKASKLAGPQAETEVEVLPWAPKRTSDDAPPLSSNPRAEAGTPPRPPVKRAPPVRTIWSRKSDAAAPAPRRIDQAADQAAPEPVTMRATPSTSTDVEPVAFPTFRIAPIEPSKLGGPLPPVETESVTGPAPDMTPRPCRVVTASFGGSKTLLLKSADNGGIRLTALTVFEGFERTLFDTYMRANALSAELVGEYDNQDDAVSDAHANCAN